VCALNRVKLARKNLGTPPTQKKIKKNEKIELSEMAIKNSI
jgi:hypothetical protein